MLARVWEGVKATLALAALVAAALVSADKLDRRTAPTSAALAQAEPAVTGAIAARPR